MSEPVWEGRVEDDLQPVLREEPAVDDLVTRRGLHPAVCRQNPEGREQGPGRDHHRRDQMGPARHQPAPEQQHAEKGRFQKESRQTLIGEKRRQDIGGGVGKSAPICAKLKRHHEARHDPHAERDGENPGPEIRQPEVKLPPTGEMQGFEQRDKAGKPDGEGRQQNVPGNHPGELQARQEERIEIHRQPIGRRRGCRKESRAPRSAGHPAGCL